MFRFLSFLVWVSVSTIQPALSDCLPSMEMEEIPEEIYVEIHPTSITSIEEMTSTFDYQFYLGYSFETEEANNYCSLKLDNLKGIFDPSFEFLNAISVEKLTPYWVEIEDYEVYVEVKYGGKFKGAFDFTSYPFDNQNLHIELNSFYSTDDLGIVLEKQDITALNELQVAGWDIKGFQSQVSSSDAVVGDETYQVIKYSNNLERNSISMVFRIFLPLLVLVSLNFLSLRLKREDFETKIEIQLAVIISIAAYSIIIDTKIPDLHYITIADAIMALVFLSSASLLAFSIIKKRAKDDQHF